jgi:transcriptional regulator with XRE-family HTH domain
MYLSQNLKILRKRKNLTQENVSSYFNIKRSTYNGYENQIGVPSLDTIIKFSDFFGVSVDVLLKLDLSKISEREFRQLEMGSDVFLKGSNIRILSHSVDSNNSENIELVSLKAKAGYTNGYADPEYIKILPTFSLPFLSKEKKYRSFQINGDSMLPIPHSSYVIGEYIQNWYAIKNGEACIVLTFDDGIVFKCVENNLKTKKQLVLHSLNKEYKSYTIDAREIKEIWKFVNYISNELPEQVNDDFELYREIANLKQDVQKIIKKIDKIS